MGQISSEVASYADAEPPVLVSRVNKRKPIKKQKQKQNQSHFKLASEDTGFGAIKYGGLNTGASSNDIAHPSITATDGALYCEIPVLNNPVTFTPETIGLASASFKKLGQLINIRFVLAVALLLIVMVTLTIGDSGQDRSAFEILSTESLTSDAIDTDKAITIINTTDASTELAIDQKKISLIQNIVALIIAEQFSQDTTINAFLDVWEEVNTYTKTNINNAPWFLPFVFSLQQHTKQYLRDNADEIVVDTNLLLKLAIAVGVMDKHGIQSSVQAYSPKYSDLFEVLQSEITMIESAKTESVSNEQSQTSESIATLRESFKKRYASNVKVVPTSKNYVPSKKK